MYYGRIKKYDIADGPGVRVTLFCSGCTNHCPGCFQQETWDFLFGKPYTAETEQQIIEALKPDYIQGLTLLGGEPFEPINQEEEVKLLRRVRQELPNKDIWAYTGFIFEKDILPANGRRHTRVTDKLLRYLDVLVDGPFIESQKDISLVFRGSRNQRILDVPESLKENKPVYHPLMNK